MEISETKQKAKLYFFKVKQLFFSLETNPRFEFSFKTNILTHFVSFSPDFNYFEFSHHFAELQYTNYHLPQFFLQATFAHGFLCKFWHGPCEQLYQ